MIVEVYKFDYSVNQDNVLGQGLLFLKQREKKIEQKAGTDWPSSHHRQKACWLLTNQHYCSYTPLHSPKWLIFVGSHP